MAAGTADNGWVMGNRRVEIQARGVAMLAEPRVVVSGSHHPCSQGTGGSAVREAPLEGRETVHLRRKT